MLLMPPPPLPNPPSITTDCCCARRPPDAGSMLLETLSYAARLELVGLACLLTSGLVFACRDCAPGAHRLVAAAPALAVHSVAPLLFRRVGEGRGSHDAEIISIVLIEFALVWLANFKLLSWVCGRGPLCRPGWTLPQFVALLLAPISPVEGVLRRRSRGVHASHAAPSPTTPRPTALLQATLPPTGGTARAARASTRAGRARWRWPSLARLRCWWRASPCCTRGACLSSPLNSCTLSALTASSALRWTARAPSSQPSCMFPLRCTLTRPGAAPQSSTSGAAGTW